MLSHEENQNAIRTIRNAIDTITNGKSRKYMKEVLSVSAEVNGKNIIIEEEIGCLFNINHDSAEINIFWEEHGFKGYKDMGLFGQMNSKWQPINELNNKAFTISDNENSYLVTISY
jgi:hypothetical protein